MSDRDSAFAEYFAARSGAMRGTAFLLRGDWHRAEDLVQAAFTKLYVHWNRVARHESLDPYVRKVLIRTFIDDGRRGWWRRVLVALGAAAAGPGLLPASGGGTPWAGPASTPATPAPADTKPTWPIDGDGKPQQNATARSGLRYQQGKRVLNGTVVFVAQSRNASNAGNGPRPLAGLPLTVPQLAALATDDRFHLQ